ncbi:hypothetical protein NU219Hw_g2007t1 [Hortaea werneckii]
MSKRGAENQGGGDRYGEYSDMQQDMGGDDKPQRANAAQLARRKIASAKGRTGARSRQQSPAIGAPQASNPFQSFQPPPTASGFNFSVPAGTTPPPNFGASQPSQNGSGGTPSFGGFGGNQQSSTPGFGGFGANNNTQSQQNGFNPSTSFSFGQTQTNGASSTPSTSFTFGQTQSQEQPKANGFNSAPNFSFGSQPSQSQQNGTSSFTFGQSQPPETPKPSAPFTFGQTPQANGDKPAGAGLFGSTAAPATEPPKGSGSIFSGLQNQSTGIKSGMFTQSVSQSTDQTSKPSNPFANFGQQNKENEQQTPQASFSFGQQGKEHEAAAPKTPFSFGASQQQDKPAEQQTPAKSLFSFGGQSEKEKPQETPKASFSFGQPAQQSQAAAEEPAKPANPFANFSFGQQQATPAQKPIEQREETPKTNLFGNIGQSKEPETSTPKTNLFGATGQSGGQESTTPKANLFSSVGQQKEPESSTPKFSFGQSQQQQETPKPAGNLFSFGQSQVTPSTNLGASQQDKSMASASNNSQKSVPEPETPAPASGKSIFERMSHQPPATAPKPSFSFSSSAAPATSSDDSSAAGKSLFERLTPKENEAPATAPKPSTAPFNASITSSAPAPPSFQTPQKPSQQDMSSSTAASATSDSKAPNTEQLRKLNNGLLAHLKTQDVGKDWSAIMEYYMTEAAKIMDREAFQSSTGPKPNVAPTSSVFIGSSGTAASTPKPTPAPPAQPAAQAPSTPAAPSVANVFAKAAQTPATAPANRKRSAEEDVPPAPATEKRAKPSEAVQYPKLPETASKTSRLFETALDSPKDAEKSSTPSTAFKPSTSFKFGSSATTTEQGTTESSQSLFRASSSSGSGFGASTTATSGFKPTFSAPAGGATNFLSAFGKQADAEVEKAKQKRMDEDYDSEDEDKDSWEAKDKAEQEAKRKQIEDAAKSGPSFSFKPSTGSGSSNSIFKLGHQDTQSQTPQQSPAKPSFGGFSFGSSQSKPAEADKSNGEESQGTGDNTWKPSTPIKFGAPTGQESTTPAAAPPKNPFAGLFGSNPTPQGKGPGSDSGKLAPPSVGFNFGAPKSASTDASRTTTPGATTDGEASGNGEQADGEPSDEQKDEQQEDMSKLTESEKEGHDVLLELPIAKGSKFDDKKNDNGSMVKGWVDKGKGPLYILKNQETGKTRVLLKVGPMGRIAMNFAAKPEFKYTNEAGKKTVGASFVDHMDPKQGASGVPSMWMISVGQAENAAKIASLLEEHKAN